MGDVCVVSVRLYGADRGAAAQVSAAQESGRLQQGARPRRALTAVGGALVASCLRRWRCLASATS